METYTPENSLQAYKTVELRKLAKEYGIKGMSSARKEQLIPAIVAAEAAQKSAEQKVEELVREIEDNKPDAEGKIRYSGPKIEKPVGRVGHAGAESNKAVRTSKGVKGKVCAECGEKPVDRKTQGRDSTMCRDCFEYAGWENAHSDEDHEANDARLDLREDCPICEKLGLPTSKPVTPIAAKALAFEADAKAAGWSALARNAADGSGISLVTARASDGRELELRWQGKVCVDGQNFFKRADGKKVKVRNASAARAILAS